MSWITPVTDRAASDITNLTSKAFFNVADWIRISGNTEYVNALLYVLRGLNITLNTLTVPGVTTIPTVTELNEFVENIELLRVASGLSTTIGLVVLKDDYEEGASSESPDYLDVNAWEENLALIKDYILKASKYEMFCGVANAGQPRFWQNRFRSPFVPQSTSPVRRPRCGISETGAGTTRQNRFRRYE